MSESTGEFDRSKSMNRARYYNELKRAGLVSDESLRGLIRESSNPGKGAIYGALIIGYQDLTWRKDAAPKDVIVLQYVLPARAAPAFDRAEKESKRQFPDLAEAELDCTIRMLEHPESTLITLNRFAMEQPCFQSVLERYPDLLAAINDKPLQIAHQIEVEGERSLAEYLVGEYYWSITPVSYPFQMHAEWAAERPQDVLSIPDEIETGSGKSTPTQD